MGSKGCHKGGIPIFVLILRSIEVGVIPRGRGMKTPLLTPQMY
jgi:hypothetical protein